MSEKHFTNLRYLPVLCFVWLMLTFIISYFIAVSLDHVHPLWPYISDTGTIPPDSCIFGLMLNIGSLLMGLVLSIRYQQVKMILATHEYSKVLNWMNIFCFVTGLLAALGACIVANFQETSNIAMHMIGANLCFGVGSGYFIVHTAICFIINKETFFMNLFRSFLCILSVITFATTLIYGKKSFTEYNASFEQALLWDSDKPGYAFRLGSTVSEWVLALCLGLYILSYYGDFKTIEYRLNFSLTNYKKAYSNDIHEHP